MILYVNGDSHAAAAEAVNLHAFAEDDGRYFYLGRAPHPDNLAVSWGRRLSDVLKAGYKCDAESASSNDRIIRTTRDWIELNQPLLSTALMIIQWSTWEREEWLHNDVYYQVNASGVDQVPQEMQEKYKHYIVGIDWDSKTQQAHDKIWAFHNELRAQGIKHIFFNGNNHFGKIADRQDWGTSYIEPYNPDATYDQWLKSHGFQTVGADSWHFGKDAHAAWSQYVLQYIIKHNLV
jgi:hypothetical protein